jgi:hypothetical protein
MLPSPPTVRASYVGLHFNILALPLSALGAGAWIPSGGPPAEACWIAWPSRSFP